VLRLRTARMALRQGLEEQRTFWRSAEYALFTFALPIALLLLLGETTAGGYVQHHVKAVALFVPSIIAFGIIVASYVNLGSKLATLRHDGVLKRIRTTPLPSSAYLSGMFGSTLITTLAITGCTVLIGWAAFGTVPQVSGLLQLFAGLALGVFCFAALGLALSSVLRSAESATPVANASYLPVAIMSGIFDPTLTLPHWLAVIVDLLPVKALAEILESGYAPVVHAAEPLDLLVLLAWAGIGAGISVWRFRWH
jgi:ABC-2 type transport system permease protein